ncbi:MAG: phosphoglycolate phosphatase [Rhodospirillales bacterium]
MAVTQVIIFDLDGTLVDSAEDIAFAVNKMLASLKLQPQPFAKILPLIGEGARRLVERALIAGGGNRATDVEPALQEFLTFYAANLTRTTKAYPDVAETLQQLANAGFRLAVCTNKPEAHSRTILDRLGLTEWFAIVVGGDTVAGVRKPDPRVLAPIVDALGVTPGEAIMVGDSITDVALARAAGMPVIACEGGYSTLPASDLGADMVIGGIDGLPVAIRRLLDRPPAEHL